MSDIARPGVVQSFQQGFGTGQQFRQNQQQQLLLSQQQEALQAKQVQEQQYQLRRKELSQKYYSGTATPAEMRELIATSNKQQLESLQGAIDNSSATENENGIKNLSPIYGALVNGQPEMAIEKLEILKAGHENAGEDKQAQVTNSMIDMIKAGDHGSKTVEFNLAQMLEGMGADYVIDNAMDYRDEKRASELHPGELKQQLLDAGYKEAQTNKLLVETTKLDNEIQKDLNKNNGVLPLEDVQTYQDDIRTEFLKYTDTSRDAATKVGKINAVADRAIANSNEDEAVQGVSDLALINSFQRLIDDGVVRGEDVALAMNTAGGGAKLANAWNNFTKGDVLTPDQRKEFKAVAGLLEAEENKAIAIVRDLYMPKIKKLGLDPTETFGELYVNLEGNSVKPTTPPPTSEGTGVTDQDIKDQLISEMGSEFADDINSKSIAELEELQPTLVNKIKGKGTDTETIKVDF